MAADYARFLIAHKFYKRGNAMIDNLKKSHHETEREFYWIYMASGFLHESEDRINPFFNLKQALQDYLNAYISYKNTGGNLYSDVILLILVPTARLYAVLGQYNNAVKTCEEALFYRPNAEIVLSLLSEISSNNMPQN